MENIIKFLISWGPAILFLVIVLLNFLFGFIIGLRRGRIFLIHTIIALTICISLYYFFINNKYTDTFILQLVNFFLGSPTGLQDRLGVSGDIEAFSGVILQYLPNQLNIDTSMHVLFQENSEYLLVIVSLIYHIAFFIIIYVLYIILKLILFIAYLIFYSDHKYKKKNHLEVYSNNTDEIFRKRRLRGGLLGAFKGMVSGLITLSVIGSAFFMISGGNRSEKLDNIATNNKELNNILTVYGYIERYGNEGFFGIMNSFADSKGNPYYLMISDLVLQGQFIDEENDFNQTLYLRKEIASYVNLAKSTINLVARYSSEDVASELLNGNMEPLNNSLVELMLNNSFENEFKSIIYNFDNDSFVLNFAMNLIGSIINNIDTLEFTSSIDENTKDLLKLLFKKGYYSPSIPSEKLESEAIEDKTILPYLKTSDLLTKSDVCEIYDIVSEILYESTLLNEDEVVSPITLIKDIIPHLNKLSILQDSKKEMMSPVLGRLYQYAACNFLQDAEDATPLSIENYTSKLNDIDWVNEINYIVDASHDILTLYENIYAPAIEVNPDENILNILFNIFDENDEKYSDNIHSFNRIIKSLGDSYLLGEVLQSKLVYSKIEEGLKVASSKFEMPSNVSYSNVYDSDGKLIKYGEITNLLKGIKAIANNTTLHTAIVGLLNNEEVDLIQLLTDNIEEFTKIDNEGKSVIDYLIDSDIVESLVSSVFIESTESTVIYIPSSVLVENKKGQKINIIKKEELRTLFNNLPTLIRMMDIAQDEDYGYDAIIYDSKYDQLLKNSIVQGTIGKLIVQSFENNDTLIIPLSLKNADEWVSTASKDGELLTLIKIVRKTEISIDELTKGGDDAYDKLLNLTSNESVLSDLLDSNIIYYTISNKLDNINYADFEVIVPTSCKTKLSNDSIEYLIKKDEIKNVFKAISAFDIKNMDSSTTEDLLRNVEKNRSLISSSPTMIASFAYFMLRSEVASIVDIPLSLNIEHDGSLQSLKNLDRTNGWNKEVEALLIALEELFEVSTSTSFQLTNEYFEEQFKELINGKLLEDSRIDSSLKVVDVCYQSNIISYTLTTTIDEKIGDNLLKNNEIRVSCKSGNIYKISEVKNLLGAFKALDLTVEEIVDYDFIDNLDDLNMIKPDGTTKLQNIYASNLLAGIITEEIEDIILGSNGLLANYDKAYRNDIDIYKLNEIEALLDILSGTKLTTDFDIKSITLNNIKRAMFIEQTSHSVSVNSYLLLATVSKNLASLNSIVIPSKSVTSIMNNGTVILKAYDIYLLFNALESISLNKIDMIDINNLTLNQHSAEAISKSDIMRATISKQINVTSDSNVVVLKVENNSLYASIDEDYQYNRILLLSEEEVYNILNGFILLSDDKDNVKLDVQIDLESLVKISRENKLSSLISSSVIHNIVSEIIVNYRLENEFIEMTTQAPSESYDYILFKSLYTDSQTRYNKTQVEGMINAIRNFIGG